MDHIDYVIKKFGADAVAIGTDVGHTPQETAAEQVKMPELDKQRNPFRSLWPLDPFKTTQEMKESIAWTNWPLYTVGLVQRGHSDEVIRKVLGGECTTSNRSIDLTNRLE